MRNYRNLIVWQKAHDFALAVYRATDAFPGGEKRGLGDQMRRAAVSIPSNLAEGYGRSGDAEFGRFLSIALGSSAEVGYQLLLAHDLGYLAPDRHKALNTDIDEIQKMLAQLRRRVASS